MNTAQLLVVVMLLAAGTAGSGAAQAQRATPTSLVAIERWVRAVLTHKPGSPDDSVAIVAEWTPELRTRLPLALELFERVLLEKGLTTQSPTDEKKRLADLAVDTWKTVGANEFFKRAAVLHADCAIFAGPAAVDPGGAPRTVVGHTGREEVLSSAGRLPVAQDGSYVGVVEENWNWRFARGLLDVIAPKPAADPFLGLWYHATSAHMLRMGLYAELAAHLARAAELLPDDPRIVFDRACLAEALGLPISQRLLTVPDLLALRAPGFRPPSPFDEPAPLAREVWTTRGGGFAIPTEEQANAAAERLMRRVLQLDKTMAEARVRLARLIDLRGRHRDAAAELNAALTDMPRDGDVVVSFYLHLFAARANRALNQFDMALDHVHTALAMFPHAQSALLAESQLQLTAVHDLSELPSDPALRADPWWLYRMGAGRDADRLLRDMWIRSRADR